MARADLLLRLVEAALAGDAALVRSVVEAIAAEERAKRHSVLANDLTDLLSRGAVSGTAFPAAIVPPSAGSGAFLEIQPKRRLHDVVLPVNVRDEIGVLIEEQHRADLLRAYNLEPRHRVLLVGPPGNGKTTCAEAIAAELSVPLLLLRYEAVITSFLGETSARLGTVLNEVRRRHCVLFLDEFDTLAKERGDEHDTGEIKRIVSTLLLQIDRLPSHVIICAATNHSELLDRAVWRRFQLRLALPAPSRREREAFLQLVADRLGMRLAKSPRTIADRMREASYAELEEFVVELRRREILSNDLDVGSARVLDRVLGAWARRARPETSQPLADDDGD
jgi:SpoVK/Ycf46/Vps4 family AAA+-type ATPase